MDSPNIKNSIALVWFARACHVAVRDEAVHYLYGSPHATLRADRARKAIIWYYVDVLTPPGSPGRSDFGSALHQDFHLNFGEEHTVSLPRGESVSAFLDDLHGMAMMAYAKSQKGASSP